ncbi:centromere protein I, partial [Elysia marginata]
MSTFTRAQASAENSLLPHEPPRSPAEQRLTLLQDGLNLLSNLDNTTNLRGNVKVSLAVENVVQGAMSDGLSPDQMITLLVVIGSRKHKLAQNVRSKLVKCLIPSSKVPQSAVIKVIYMITANAVTGPTNLHSLLLRWVLVVFDHLDGYEKIHNLYGLIFMFIDSARLLPYACQLLFLLTRKEDVALFRVQKLLELVQKLGPEPCIMGLLMMYKVYCPHLVTIRLTYGTKAFFKNQDVVWRETIQAVASERRQEEIQQEVVEDVKRARQRRQTAQRRMVKRQKLMLPDVHAAMQELEDEPDLTENFHPAKHRVPYVQIDTFTSFLKNFDNIE